MSKLLWRLSWRSAHILDKLTDWLNGRANERQDKKRRERVKARAIIEHMEKITMPKIPLKRWKDTPEMPRGTVKKIIIHCSDSEQGDVLNIDQWHLANGWTGIGYHYVIKRNGEYEFGRPLDKVGAHCHGENEHSIGICLIGKPTFIADDPKEWYNLRMMSTLRAIILDILNDGFPIEEIEVHNKYANKICPGFTMTLKHSFGVWAFKILKDAKGKRNAGLE